MMKRVGRCAFTLLACLFTGLIVLPARAVEDAGDRWGLLGLVDDESRVFTRVFYGDVDNVIRTKRGGLLHMLVVKVKREGPEAIQYELVSFQYDCPTDMERRVGWSLHRPGQDVLDEDSQVGEWAPILPRTIQREASNMVCKGLIPKRITQGLASAYVKAEEYVAAPRHLTALETTPLF